MTESETPTMPSTASQPDPVSPSEEEVPNELASMITSVQQPEDDSDHEENKRRIIAKRINVKQAEDPNSSTQHLNKNNGSTLSTAPLTTTGNGTPPSTINTTSQPHVIPAPNPTYNHDTVTTNPSILKQSSRKSYFLSLLCCYCIPIFKPRNSIIATTKKDSNHTGEIVSTKPIGNPTAAKTVIKSVPESPVVPRQGKSSVVSMVN